MNGKKLKPVCALLIITLLCLTGRIVEANDSQEIEPPSVTITEPPLCRCPGKEYDTDAVTIEWESEEGTYPISHHEIQINTSEGEGEWIDVGMNTKHTFEDLEGGDYGVRVRVEDTEGNEDIDGSKFVVDTFPDQLMWQVIGSSTVFTLLFVFGLIYHKKKGTPAPQYKGVKK
ncbi:MAG: hypothetical protein R6U17_02740 [Thermoplasmata archaeon]